MLHLVFGRDAEVCTFVSERIKWGAGGNFEDKTPGIAVCDDYGKIVAGVVYHDHVPKFETVQITMAADNPMWARRDLIAGLLHYPFRQLNCYKVWIVTRLSEVRAIKTFEHVGFKREAVLAHQFGRKQHAWVGRMLQPDYARFYEE